MSGLRNRNSKTTPFLSFSKAEIEDDSETDENECESVIKFEHTPEETRKKSLEEEDYDEEEEDDDFEGELSDRPRIRELALNSTHFRNRRPSRANLFGKVAMSSSIPSRSLSFNSSRLVFFLFIFCGY